jgi:lipid II:glycine glycyltransferase (peptidoglycan interpeptide bridge formation enzyme)
MLHQVAECQVRKEELLKQMKSKTRYNIRLAEKRGVNVYQTREKRHQEAFMALVGVTAERDGIRPHPKSYYEAMFATFPSETWELFVAEYEGEVIAANLIIFFGRYATYLHGSSANEHREVMAPYLLQWRAIQEARAHGCRWYDFGGVDTRGEEGSWAGITRFKLGFAPTTEMRKFPGAYDVILNPWRYRWYRALRKLRKIIGR